jgi:hypothetical protein
MAALPTDPPPTIIYTVTAATSIISYKYLYVYMPQTSCFVDAEQSCLKAANTVVELEKAYIQPEYTENVTFEHLPA